MAQNRKNSRRTSSKRKNKNWKENDRNTREQETCDSVKRDMKGDKTNDPVWYAQTPELMRLAANIPFSHATGTAFNLDLYNDSTGTDVVTSADQVVPGVMTLTLVPIPTLATKASSPLNIAATSMFSFVRHANSGTPQYNSPDLMIYAISMGQVYSYINFLQRIYGCVNMYANMNRYLPRVLVESQGVNFDSIQQNIPNFKYGINALIHKAASLACPAGMTYFQRLAFLFSNIYAEGETIKDQLYMYVPEGFLQFSETKEETGGSLQYLQFWKGAGSYTYDQLIDFGNSLLDPIISSEDMNIMSGDILKAYGSNGILTLQTLPDVYIVNPITDLNVLEQFQNSGRTGSAPTEAKIIQSQKGIAGSLRSIAKFEYDAMTSAIMNGAKVLTTILTNPEAGDVMERTRLMLSGYGDPTNGMFVEMATEIPCVLRIVTINPTNGLASYTTVRQRELIATSTTPETAWTMLNQHCMLENFKFHPAVYYFTRYTGQSNYIYQNLALDIDNYAIINPRDINRMNDAALLSMFNVQSVARAY